LGSATVETVEADVSGYLTLSGINGATVTVTPSPLISAQGGDPVTVAIDVPFSAVSWLPVPAYLGGVVLTSSVTMRREVYTTPEESP
jgi:hypothetical protein